VTTWLPLSIRGTDAEQLFEETLYEGVPAHMESSLSAWTFERFDRGGSELVMRMERQLRLSFSSQHPVDAHAQVWNQEERGDNVLDAVDWMLHDMEVHTRAIAVGAITGEEVLLKSPVDVVNLVVSLMRMLTDCASAWTVELEPYWHLAKRMDETVQTQARTVVSGRTAAGDEIAKAWVKAFGRSPDYAAAYRHAVLAVESEAVVIFSPTDRSPTLGKSISHLAQTLDRYTVAGLDGDRVATSEVLLGMMRMIWIHQPRHASRDTPVREPTERELIAVVTTAVTLVQWFQAGLVGEKPIVPPDIGSDHQS
jgi:hypothetical protein